MSRPAADARASAGWRGLAWRLYEHLPRAADLPLRLGTRALLPVTNRHVPLTLLRGPVASGGAGTVLFAGAPGASAYVAQRFFTEQPAAEALGHVPIWRLGAEIDRRRAAVDLVVARLDRLSARLALDGSYVAVPEWIGALAPVPADAERLCRDRKSLAHNLARARRAELRPDVSHALGDFEEFYERMYVPFIRRRHGSESVVTNRERLRRCFRQGGLMWALQGEERVAGLLYRVRRHTVDLVVIGAPDGPRDVLREGAIFALDLFLFDHARTLGCTIVDFGGSRPCPTNGLLLTKARWDARIVENRTMFYDLFLSWDRLGAPLLGFLTRSPLIFRQSDGLAALWGPESGASIRTARSVLRSLQRLYVLGGADAAQGADGEIPTIHVDPTAEPHWRPSRVVTPPVR